MKNKKVFLYVILAFVIFIGGIHLYIKFTSNSAYYYSSVSSYKKENGEENFIDMYDPEAYFDTTIKKETLSDINHITIYHVNDPDNYYSMVFDDVIEDTDLSISFCKDALQIEPLETYLGESLDNYILKEYEEYSIYSQLDEYRPAIVGVKDSLVIILAFEPDYEKELSQEEIENLVQVGEIMMRDIFKLNFNI